MSAKTPWLAVCAVVLASAGCAKDRAKCAKDPFLDEPATEVTRGNNPDDFAFRFSDGTTPTFADVVPRPDPPGWRLREVDVEKARTLGNALAGWMLWNRADDREQEMMLGATIGYVVGVTVAPRRIGDFPVRILPWLHPVENATGFMWAIHF